MEIVILKNAEEVARRAADRVCLHINRQPDCVLGLATGSTPVALYRELIERNRAGQVSFRHVRSFNLDEYVGLPAEHPASYRRFMNEQLFDHIDIDKALTHLPHGLAENPLLEGPEYEQQIARAGGIDLQILGIGSDGHIGFNEPTSSLGSRTRVKTLTQQTLDDNARFFEQGETMPTMAFTMGIGTILEAGHVLLLATGAHKAPAIAAAVEGPVTAMCPASALQWHPKTCFIMDEAAASELRLKTYYMDVLARQDALTAKHGPAI